MPRTRPEDQELTVEVADGRLVISIGTKTLADAFERGEVGTPYDEKINDWRLRYRVTDPKVFANEVRRVLDREDEEGTTAVHLLFDKAFSDALDDGADGVDEAA